MRELTLRSVFVDALERFGTRPAITFRGRSHSYADVVSAANQLAHRLAEAGVGPGTVVALLMSNCPEYVIADQAIARCGAVKVPLSDMLSASEIDYILADSGASPHLAPGAAPIASHIS